MRTLPEPTKPAADEASRQALYDQARMAATAFTERLKRDYPAAAGLIAGLLSDLARTQALIDEANACHPTGRRFLPDIEAFRGRPACAGGSVDGVEQSAVPGWRPPRLTAAVALPGLTLDDDPHWPPRRGCA